MLPPGDCGLRFLGIKCVFVGLALLLGVSPVFISCVMRDMVISKPLRAFLFVLAHLACCKYPSDVSGVFVLTKSLCVCSPGWTGVCLYSKGGLPLSLRSSCLRLPSVEITNMCHHSQLEVSPSILFCYIHSLSRAVLETL